VSARAGQRRVDVVVKIGGGLLAHPAALDAVVRAVANAAHERRVVVVPGGGPFADAVRAVDTRVGLEPATAHWMAVLAMDQFAHLLAERAARASIVAGPAEIDAALGEGRLAVLAPYAWLRAANPLTHSWAVTSDSIAAWVAGALGAPALVLVKPPGAADDARATDDYFMHTLPDATTHAIVPADRIDQLALALRGGGMSRPGR